MLAVAVTDLQTGETVSVNGDEPHLTGCTINFFVLLQVVRDWRLAATPNRTVGSLIAATIYSSNPVTAHECCSIRATATQDAAIDKVNSLMQQTLGMTPDFYDHPPAYIQESIRRPSNMTSPPTTSTGR